MTRCLLALALLGLPAGAADPPAGVPAGYKLLYSQDFARPDAVKDFAFPDPAAWRLTAAGGRPALEQFRQAEYKPPHRSPFNYCLLAGKTVGDFVMDVECQQTSKEYDHRSAVFVFGWQSPTRFYYTHIASKSDQHANNIFIVKDATRTKIGTVTNAGNDWGDKDATWRTVRVARTVAGGRIKVYFDDLGKPFAEAADTSFGPGRVGFGTFDDTVRVRSVKVWGPAAEDVPAPEFPKK